MKYGYTLSSEEFGPTELVENAARAEAAGFDFVGISDHFHPWISRQGQSPFSWSVIGAVAHATKEVEIFAAVVCPFMRYHPAIVAQAAATSQLLSGGRFVLGLGTGEYLNEHIVGMGWPHIHDRFAMLGEAIEIIRELFEGKTISYKGEWLAVEAARLYSLPDTPPPLVISAFGPKAATLAGQLGDGFVSVAPLAEWVQAFEENGGKGKPKYGQMNVCYHTSEKEAKQLAAEYWPNGGLQGQMMTELRMPAYFEQAAEGLTLDQATSGVVTGAKVESYIEMIEKYRSAGYDHIYFHQIGPMQHEFLHFAKEKLLPALATSKK